MIGLRDLVQRDVRSWEEASARFSLPAIERYNIAADCLRAPRDAPALLVADGDTVRSVTFGELAERSARFAAALSALDVQPGDRVAVKLSQGVDMAVAILAALRVGAIVVPISNVLGEDGVVHRLGDSAPRVLIAAGSESEAALAARAGAVLVAATGGGGQPTMRDVIAAAPAAGGPAAATTPDTPAILLYTSGTTGKPKGVLHGHRVLLGHHAIDYALDFIRPDDVSYGPVDWAWGGGLFLGFLVPLAHGVPVVAFREPRFDAERTIQLLRACGVSIGLFPPTVLRLLRQSGLITPDIASKLRLRCLVTGAEAVEPELFGWAAEELGVTVNNAYGQTEANALVGHSTVLGALDPGCLGRAYPGRRVAVLDDSLRPVTPGEPGQIAVAVDDPVCMLGYWNDQDATTRKIVDGWLPTGDTAHVDDRGQFVFHGRSDDIIKSGAYRIGPSEIEAALLLDASVAECAVVGLPDAVRGEVVTAFVRLRRDAIESDELTERLQQQVRAKVGAHAYPRDVRYIADLPRSTTGKVDRATLRRRFAEGSVRGPAMNAPDRRTPPSVACLVVVGGGTMGRGIAGVALAAGVATTVVDVDEARLAAAREAIARRIGRDLNADQAEERMRRLELRTDLDAAVDNATVVIEAVPEVMELKADVFARAHRYAPPDALLATNTSTVSVSRLAEACGNSPRVIGMHFFNPVHRMPLVEVVVGRSTSDRTVRDALALAARLEKDPIVVKDVPGFVTSRLGLLLGNEAMRMVEEGVASAADIDKAMRLGYRHPMGPLELADLVGLDARLNNARSMYEQSRLEQYRPPAILTRLVESGRLGRKAGSGFYRYDDDGTPLGPAETNP